MEVTVTIPELELWQWCTLAGLAWYAMAAVVIRYALRGRHLDSSYSKDDMQPRLALWLFSPLVVVVGALVVLPMYGIARFLDSSGKSQ